MMSRIFRKAISNGVSKYRLFSESPTQFSLYQTSGADLSLLPSSTQSTQVSLKLVDAIPATEDDLENFIHGYSPPGFNPVQIFFRTKATPVKLDGLDNVVGWREEQVIVDIMAYSMNHGIDVVVPENSNENDSSKKP